MRTSDVRSYFKNSPSPERAIAELLGISVQAVNQWGELVPPLSAARLAKRISDLEFDPDAYAGWNGRK